MNRLRPNNRQSKPRGNEPHMRHHAPYGPVILLWFLMTALAGPSGAQMDNPVYVDDSPQAWMLFQQAQDQLKDNIGESARLYQELLSEFSFRLIPIREREETHFASVRHRVLLELRADPDLMARYRLIETAAAQRLLDANNLIRVAQTRSLTEAGLEALLRLGQQNLESGRFHTSLRWLEEAIDHPDLDDRRGLFLWHMIGTARYFLDDEAGFEESCRIVSTFSGGDEYLNHLQLLKHNDIGPGVPRGLSPLDTSSSPDLSGLIAEDIWSIPLEHSLLNRRYPVNPDDPTLGRDVREQRRRQGVLNTSAPTIAGETVYINEGHYVHAMDRFTGRPIWDAPFTDRRQDEPDDTNVDQTQDMNIIAVEGDALVTLTGHLLSRNRSNSGKVVCLDAMSGDLRWIRDISHIDEADEFERLFPHGRPIIRDGAVYVMARKTRRQQLTASYVVSLDLTTGDLRWSRHISTSGGTRGTARPFSSLTFHQGSLYVATPLGAMAKIEPFDGEIRWLHRYPVPLNTTATALHRPWEFDAPVFIDEKVIAVRPDRMRVVVLDRKTGEELESHFCTTAESWDTPKYLLANEHSVYAVGRDVVAFRAGDLDDPVWRLSSPPLQFPENEPSFLRPEIRGRVQLVDDHLVIPTLFGIQIVDDQTGIIDHELVVPVSGNPVAFDSQLLLASSDRLDSYMSFDRALEMLRERIASSPGDPNPGLSLLKLGIRVRKFTLALDAANLVIEAMNRSTFDENAALAHDELFDHLLEINEQGLAESESEGEALFALINSMADTAFRRIEYLLEYGHWLGRTSPEKAIEQAYQAILSNPQLASTWRQSEGAVLAASTWAAQQQLQLIQRHDQQIYAAQNDFARLRFEQIMSDEHPDALELVTLIEEFPFADTLPDAACAASNFLDKQAEPRSALSLLAFAHRTNSNSRATSMLLGKYVSLCLSLEWNDEAISILNLMSRHHPDLQLDTEDGPRTAEAWMKSIFPDRIRRPRRAVGRPTGEALFLEGVVVPFFPGVPEQAPPDSILLQADESLRRHRSGTTEPVWKSTYEDATAQILHFDDKNLLLWYGIGDDIEDPRAVMVDADTGEVRWISADIITHLGDPVRDLKRVNTPRRQRAPDQSFDPRRTLPFYNGRALIKVLATGGVLALSVLDGQTVLWKKHNTINRVHDALLHDSALIIAGEIQRSDTLGATIRSASRLEAFDADTGVRLWQVDPIGNAPVRWMKTGGLGLLAYGTSGGIELLDIYTGHRIWSNVAGASRDSQIAWNLDDRILINDRDSRLRTLMLSDARLSAPFDLTFNRDMNPLELREIIQVDEESITARYRNKILMLDLDGNPLGDESITNPRDYKWLLPTGDQYLLINAHHPRQVPQEGQSRTRSEFIYELYIMSDNGMIIGQPYQFPKLSKRLQQVRLIGSWLFISSRERSYGIPMVQDE